jgi:acetylornithine deacetylase/succinyl-diaminopimelate desuccinylase-like protein
MSADAAFARAFDQGWTRCLREWQELLRFASVSADPAHEDDCRACAAWLADYLGRAGFAARLLPTATKPVVYAERRGAPGKPALLFYGHYDVQPADPLGEWTTPPFEPALRDGRLYARGAEDNKGQFFYALKAMEDLIRDGRPLPTLRVIIEGEEECGGSPGMSAGLAGWRDLVRADYLATTDTQMLDPDTPTLIMGLRGVLHLTVELGGPTHDLHSGVHGGVAPNPATEIARLLATLHNPDGTVAVPGFYDGVADPTGEERRFANARPFDLAAYRAATGLTAVRGDARYTPAERLGFRPCLDVNGIHTGYGGAGSKTVIPCRAMAKVTARTVAGQDPNGVLAAIEAHLRRHAPPGLTLAVTEKGVGGPAFRMSPGTPAAARARAALRAVTGAEPVFHWDGASIPIVAQLAQVAGAQPILAGFGLEEDRAHAPNESFAIERFRLGYLYIATLLASL